MPGAPATATKRVRDDVTRLLKLREPVVDGLVDRPNIYLEVVDGDGLDEKAQ